MANETTITYKCPYLGNRSNTPCEALVNIANGVPVSIICANHTNGDCVKRIGDVEYDLKESYLDKRSSSYQRLFSEIEGKARKIDPRTAVQRAITEMQSLFTQAEIKTRPQRRCIVAEGFKPLA